MMNILQCMYVCTEAKVIERRGEAGAKDSIWAENIGYSKWNTSVMSPEARPTLSHTQISSNETIDESQLNATTQEYISDKHFQSDLKREQTWFHNKLRQSTPITRNALGNERVVAIIAAC